MPFSFARSVSVTVLTVALAGSPSAAALLGDTGARPPARTTVALGGAAGSSAALAAAPVTAVPGRSSAAAAVETVRFTVPAVLMGGDDGAPPVLAAGRSYRLRISALAAESGASARVSVAARGARVTGCAPGRIPTGTVLTLRCDLVVPRHGARREVEVVVTATGGAGTRVSTAYRHTVG